ncbi:ATP-binding protein [uncultured Anaerovibrio sp.]|uniref:ATP-binding protein n=1 Tax=uncultured Anaerovibrio sp. TaxID=361586 RepID=UPI0026174728|nr:ATP-binding protein [uncultured Anaerovibrio sp.]
MTLGEYGMFREILNNLMKWKNKSSRKPLIITGVRQCGKTYIVEKFGKSNFTNYVYINFEANKNYGAIFDFDFDVTRIIHELEGVVKKKIIPGETLVFFDEVQECPSALTSLKYFCENLRSLHLICAGSLLGIALKSDNISFPVGKVNRMKLYPMNFKEFVIANERKDLIDIFENWPMSRPIPKVYYTPLEKLLKDYYIVGGMPEVVNTWLETRSYAEVEEVQREILDDYADDFSKHAPFVEIPKIRWIWESIPVQLAKENNKFVFSHVKKGKRSAELENALQWLEEVGLISAIHLVEKPENPLSGQADKTYFKVYMSDIGLLRAKSNLSYRTIIEEDSLYIKYKGALAENYVLNELKTLGKCPYFWRSGNSAEIDFLFEDGGEIIPIEVKSADNTQAKSYRQFCKKYNPKVGFKLSRKNLGENLCENTKTLSIPLYLTWNINSCLRKLIPTNGD